MKPNHQFPQQALLLEEKSHVQIGSAKKCSSFTGVDLLFAWRESSVHFINVNMEFFHNFLSTYGGFPTTHLIFLSGIALCNLILSDHPSKNSTSTRSDVKIPKSEIQFRLFILDGRPVEDESSK